MIAINTPARAADRRTIRPSTSAVTGRILVRALQRRIEHAELRASW
jgi:hypothetical protein